MLLGKPRSRLIGGLTPRAEVYTLMTAGDHLGCVCICVYVYQKSVFYLISKRTDEGLLGS